MTQTGLESQRVIEGEVEGVAALVCALAAFVSCCFPSDYVEEEALKHIRVTLLPTAEVNPLCGRRKKISACRQSGLSSSSITLLLLCATASYQGRE